jgi:hypothetical protein
VAEPEIKPDDKTLPDGDSKTGLKPKGSAGLKGAFGKHKWLILGGGGIGIVALFMLMKSKGNAATSATAAQGTAAGTASAGIDPATGYQYGSPADVAALGGSGTATGVGGGTGSQGDAGPSGAAGATGATGATGAQGNGLVALTFAQAQKLAGSKGSSSLFYGSGSSVKQGKYANDKNVTYYTTPGAALKVGATVPKLGLCNDSYRGNARWASPDCPADAHSPPR